MSAPVLTVACLCAQWCGTCRDYTATFSQLQAALPQHHYRWIDIEDEAELVGDVDVETFPTLLVTHGARVLFAGPVLPRLSDATRLLATQEAQAGVGTGVSLSQAGMLEDQALAFERLAQALQR
jgi:thiol-disulfide isomerase/thioredoxin